MLLNQITILLFCAFAPLFVMSLMFEQTKGMFWQWIKFGFSTMFSLGVLTIMALIVSDTVLQFAKGAGMALVAKYISGSTSSGAGSLAGMAMQQGGLGLIMTALLVTVPNMVGQFFGGTVGSFQGSSVFQNYLGNNQASGNGTTQNANAINNNHSAQIQQHRDSGSNTPVKDTPNINPYIAKNNNSGFSPSHDNQQTDAVKLKTGSKSDGSAIAASS